MTASQTTPEHVLIVGGGASGVLMAAHLLHQQDAGTRVTIIERSELLGCGIAYSTDNPAHMLNTRVTQMSAFPDDPGHFRQWLDDEGRTVTDQSFVDRGTYGQYLASLIAPWREGSARLHCVQGECIGLAETGDGVIASLNDGSTLKADRVVLATGHAVPANPAPPLRGGWDFRPPADPAATVAIIGTGLSMVDHVVTLLRSGHRGPIFCLSRRGLLPQAHEMGKPLPVRFEDIPLGASVSTVMAWLRGLVAQAEAMGGTWRDAVDGIRPHVAAIWHHWPLPERARFLRHAASWWEVHRHRMPQISANRISLAIESGQLRILRGSFIGAEIDSDNRIALSIRDRKTGGLQTLVADHVIDCRGVRRDPREHAAPVVRSLLADGAARLDKLELGLDTTTSARVIDEHGTPSERLFAIGPAARGALWEITAIPDIRQQVAALAQNLGRHEQQTEAEAGSALAAG